jgi:hypothetical protein
MARCPTEKLGRHWLFLFLLAWLCFELLFSMQDASSAITESLLAHTFAFY